jgi:hypothetical protein
MVQPNQPNKPKPGPKLTRLLEIFFKTMIRRDKATNEARRKHEEYKLKVASEAVRRYKGDAHLNRLQEKTEALHERMADGDTSEKTIVAFTAALEEWWAYLKSPWDDGTYDSLKATWRHPIGNHPSNSKPSMANEKQTPADTGTKSTDAGAVKAAGKTTTRGKDTTIKVGTKLTTQLARLTPSLS